MRRPAEAVGNRLSEVVSGASGNRTTSYGYDAAGRLTGVQLTSTQVYTRVSIARLKAVHTATHRAALLEGKRAGDKDPEEGR